MVLLQMPGLSLSRCRSGRTIRAGCPSKRRCQGGAFNPSQRARDETSPRHLTTLRRTRLYGSDNPDALRGRGFNMTVLDEYADMPPSLFPAVIRPALADKQGRLIFIGTVKGRENHLWQTYTSRSMTPNGSARCCPPPRPGSSQKRN
jgi:hypothetical protein